MELNINKENTNLTVGVAGRLDTTTAPDLEKALDFTGVETFVLDFKDLEYISSAGLRVILNCQKTMNKQGKMTLVNVNDDIKEIFELTGFADILNIE